MDTSTPRNGFKYLQPDARRWPSLQPMALMAMVLALTGCAGMSGLGGSSEFKCSAPTGIPCRSVTAVDLADRAGTAPDEPSRTSAERERMAAPSRTYTSEEGWSGGPTAGGPPPAPRPYKTSLASGSVVRPAGAPEAVPLAIRSAPTQLRMWIAPWKDADGDLNDETYVFMVIDNGRWLVEHNRERIRRAFAPRAVEPSPVAAVAPAAAAQGPQNAPGAAPSTAQRTPEEVTAALARAAAMAELERKRQQPSQVDAAAKGQRQ